MNPAVQWITAFRAIIDARPWDAWDALGGLTMPDLLELQGVVTNLSSVITEICQEEWAQ